MDLDLGDFLQRIQGILRGIALALPNVVLGVLVFVVFWLVSKLVARLVRAITRRAGQPPGVRTVLARLVTWAILGLGLLVALTVIFPTLNAASLFGALGVGSVAIGFAFKDIFQNLLAGILILLTRPFRIGDQIVSGDNEGTVESIEVRATMLRTYDNRRVVIPNSDLYTNRVTVNTAYGQRRLAVDVGIGYGDDIPTAKAVAAKTVAALPGILTEPAPTVLVTVLGDFAVNLSVRFWIDPPHRREAVEAQDQVLEALKSALLDAGIDLPLPTQQLLLHNQTEPSDGDRRQQREGWPPETTGQESETEEKAAPR